MIYISKRIYDELTTEKAHDGANDVCYCGWHRAEYKYDERGNKIEESYYGLNDEAVINTQHGLHKIISKYDERGNKIEESYYGINNEPVIHEL